MQFGRRCPWGEALYAEYTTSPPGASLVQDRRPAWYIGVDHDIDQLELVAKPIDVAERQLALASPVTVELLVAVVLVVVADADDLLALDELDADRVLVNDEPAQVGDRQEPGGCVHLRLVGFRSVHEDWVLTVTHDQVWLDRVVGMRDLSVDVGRENCKANDDCENCDQTRRQSTDLSSANERQENSSRLRITRTR